MDLFGAALTGAIIGSVATHWLQGRADRRRWHRDIRHRLYATTLTRVRDFNEALDSYLTKAQSILHFYDEPDERILEDSSVLESRWRGDLAVRRRAVRKASNNLRGLQAEYDLIAPRHTYRLFIVYSGAAWGAAPWRELHLSDEGLEQFTEDVGQLIKNKRDLETDYGRLARRIKYDLELERVPLATRWRSARVRFLARINRIRRRDTSPRPPGW